VTEERHAVDANRAKLLIAFCGLFSLVAGCLDLGEVNCDGWVCPPETICYAPTKSCAPRAVLQACQGKNDGSECWFPGAGINYYCQEELCVPVDFRHAVCGNGVIEVGEACEDFNTADGDGCSAACRLEVCGDGSVTGAETCDGEDQGGASCAEFGLSDGVLGCGSDCRAIPVGCHTCGNDVCEAAEDPATCAQDCATQNAADVLFVIGTKPFGMEAWQERLREAIPSLVEALHDPGRGMPDLHVGVVTTNQGIDASSDELCQGDMGLFVSSPNIACGNFVSDVRPTGCATGWNGEACVANTCDAQDCLAVLPEDCGFLQDISTLYYEDSRGCPRCRNTVEDNSLAAVVGELVVRGESGSGFPQPLQAVECALGTPGQAVPFLRNGATLVLVFLAGDDDCSAASTVLYDRMQVSVLGPRSTYRCFRFGVTCEGFTADEIGVRSQCWPTPDEDEQVLLRNPDHYLTFLWNHLGKAPGKLVTWALAGPRVEDGAVVVLDNNDDPIVERGCEGSSPAIRLEAFIARSTPPDDLTSAAGSICDADYHDSMRALGERILRTVR